MKGKFQTRPRIPMADGGAIRCVQTVVKGVLRIWCGGRPYVPPMPLHRIVVCVCMLDDPM